jgi:MFS transporter, DHA1 family, multidrug resistance protein
VTNKQLVPYFLVVSISLPIMAIDLHLPSLPMMAKYFHVSTAVIKNTISAFQFGLLASAMIYGPMSDSYGRRPILLFGSSLFVISSILLVFSTQIESFLTLRFMQGCGGGVAAALVPAILSDTSDEGETSKVLAQMAVVILMTPAFAPLLGGYLAAYFGWQSCFMFLSLCSLLSFTAFYLYFPETNLQETRSKIHIAELLKKYKGILSNKKFMAYALLHSTPSAGTWCMITIMPFILINHMGLKPQHLGYYITTLVIILSTTSFYVQRVVINKGLEKILSLGIKLLFVGGGTAILAGYFAPMSPILTIMGIISYPMGLQFIFPASQAKAMTAAGSAKGTGSSTITTLRQIFAVFGSFVAVFLPDSSLLPAAGFLLCTACFAAGCYYIANKD